jgi:hypothetical protein
MENDPDPNLEQLIHRELQKLSHLSAPTTLVPRVMAALQARAQARPWWHRAWWNWPLPAKAAFLVVAVVLAGFVSRSGSMVSDSVSTYSQQAIQRLGFLSILWDILVRLADGLGGLWLKAGEPLLVYGLVAAAILYLMCIGLGTLFVRVASKPS